MALLSEKPAIAAPKSRRGLRRLRDAILAGGGIASRLTFYIVVFSTAITAITTAIQLGLEYRLEIQSISSRFAEIRSSQLPILTNSVWILDDTLIRTQLDGLSRLPDIERLSVLINGKPQWQVGTAQSTYTLVQHFPLIQHSRDKNTEIGVLEIVASLDNIYERIWDRLLIDLLNNAVKTALVAIFALVLFQLTVTRHLYRLADYAQHIDLDDPVAIDLRLDRRRHQPPDVLDQLVEAIVTMRVNLTDAFAASRRNEQRTRRENYYLTELLRVDLLQGEGSDTSLQRVSETIAAALDVAQVGLWHLDATTNLFLSLDLFDPKTGQHGDAPEISKGDLPLFLEALNQDKIIVVRDIRTDPRCSEICALPSLRSDIVSFIGAAVQFDGRLRAALIVAHSGLPRQWTPDEVSFTGAVAALLAAAMAAQDREIAQRELSTYKDQLEDMVARRTAELTQANLELNRTLAILRNTQAELVDREKLASLGSIVAGVAHEVNTPIGVGVTAATALKSMSERLAQKLDTNTLRKSDLTNYVENAVKSADILEANLMRAADLVRSFKQVAVDQSTEAIRRIELGSYVNDVITSLRPELRKGGHSVEIETIDPIEIETTPAALWQILSNLVMNSMLHGFEPGQHGQFRVRVERQDDTAIITYQDNGKGMSAEVKRRIFEPFFTTKRGQGGSGLGLSIVYNLATATLGGTITCESMPDAGAAFTLTIPLRDRQEQPPPDA